MKLYFSPLACSLACRIALYETNTDATYVSVDLKMKTTEDGRDFTALSPAGMVPALELAGGDILTENTAVLQYLAAQSQGSELALPLADGSVRLHQWLGFVATEVHKAVFSPLMDDWAPPEAKSYALGKAPARLAWLDRHLSQRPFLIDRFSVADAYLYSVLNWAPATPIDLAARPAVHAYHRSIRERPAVSRAYREELALYQQRAARTLSPEPAPSRSLDRATNA